MSSQYGIEDKARQGGPPSELELYETAVESGADDQFLGSINLGLGNYTAREQWQQVESYTRGMYAESAFGRQLFERALLETQVHLGLHGHTYFDINRDREVSKDGWLDLDDQDSENRRDWILNRGQKTWDRLPDEEKKDLLAEIAGFEGSWIPPYWRMMQVRHETSRSKGARLLDNLFGRVKQFLDQTRDAENRLEEAGSGL